MIIVGLGNPGKQYEMTRHNIGFMVVDTFASRYQLSFSEDKKVEGAVAKGIVEGQKVLLLKPKTYMNESGRSVRKCIGYYKDQKIIVVVDDIALDFGVMRVREKGSSGGHNGLRSIEHHLHTQNYIRLRMGIGHHGTKRLADHVLDPFTKEELKLLPDFREKGADILKRLIVEDVERVMTDIKYA